MIDNQNMFTEAARAEFDERGYVVARGLFSREEAQGFIDHYMAMRDRGGDGWAEDGVHPESEDPLKRYPRLLQPHRNDPKSMGFMVDPRIDEWLTGLLGLSPFGVQTMVYFKPPGARGQALHQDQRYLRVDPGTCVAAWMALDDCDEENGCMSVVPGSQNLPMLCPFKADLEKSFSGETVPVPPGLSPEPVVMAAGDVLFFNGSVIHGSPPNHSNRFRRILVGHYIVGEARQVAEYYFPVFAMDGSVVDGLEVSPSGGSCGRFVERDGATVIDMTETLEGALAAH
jgi:ectoine hydroxylase-related dioxygenase (phytanoyl-CoA dioxygenase family)